MYDTAPRLDSPPDMEHSLRTRLAILTLLSGNLDLLYERLDEEKRRQMIRDIRTQTQVLSELVCDVIKTSGGQG
jgi:hypothetical protein